MVRETLARWPIERVQEPSHVEVSNIHTYIRTHFPIQHRHWRLTALLEWCCCCTGQVHHLTHDMLCCSEHYWKVWTWRGQWGTHSWVNRTTIGTDESTHGTSATFGHCTNNQVSNSCGCLSVPLAYTTEWSLIATSQWSSMQLLSDVKHAARWLHSLKPPLPDKKCTKSPSLCQTRSVLKAPPSARQEVH